MEKNFGLCCYLDVSTLPAQMAGTFQTVNMSGIMRLGILL